MVRAFVGVDIPEDVKRYIISVQEQLQPLPMKAKLVEPENLHISLSFLGDIEDTNIESVKLRLDEISNLYDKFEIVLEDLLLIPNEKFVRVIALNVKSDNLESLRKIIVKAVGGKSHPAHLTLARVNVITEKENFIENINKVVCNRVSFKIDSVCLIGSILQKSGPVYTILHEAHLK